MMDEYSLEVAYDELLYDYSELVDLLRDLYNAHDQDGSVIIDFWEMQSLLDGAHHILEMGGEHTDVRQEDDEELDE